MVTRLLAPLLMALLLSGCAVLDGYPTQGQLYTDVTLPHSTDFHNTRVGDKTCVLDEYQVREPVSGYGVTVEWSTDRILAAARAAGISNISYTEQQTVSVLFGIYKRQRLIIHGD